MSTATSTFYVTGGTLRPDAPSYVERQADRDLNDGLKAGEFCYVLHSRQMGKSSLMAHTTLRLRAEGIAVVNLDLTRLGQNLTVEQWYDGLLTHIGRQLDLEDELEEYWEEHERQSPLQRWLGALQEVVLGSGVQAFRRSGVQEGAISEPERLNAQDHRFAGYPPKGGWMPPERPYRLVIAIDEIDAVRSLPFSTDDFFAAIRDCYNRRTQDPEFQRLTFCLLGVATPSDLIQDTRTTPFNIGKRIELSDFTQAEAAPLARGLGRDEASGRPLLQRVLYWTGGHPYLTQRLCQAVATDLAVADAEGVDRLCGELFLSTSAQEKDDNLLFVRERLLHSEADTGGLLELYGWVRAGKRVAVDDTSQLVSLLRLSGITRVTDGRLRLRNRIYERVFDRAWVTQHMPDAELRRQRAAYLRGLARATAGAAVIVAVIAALALAAVNQSRLLRRSLYGAQMNLAQQAAERGDLARARALLDAQRPHLRSVWMPGGQEDFRSFDWRLLWGLCRDESLFTFQAHTTRVVSVAFSPDGRTLASACGDGTVKLWDIATKQPAGAIQGDIQPLTAMAFSPDGKMLATGNDDKKVRLWSAVTKRQIARLEGHADVVGAVAFSPDGRTLASGPSGGSDGTVKLWSVAGRQQLATLKGHAFPINGLAFSPDGKLMASAGQDQTVKLWNVAARREAATLTGHDLVVSSVAFSPDGRTLASGSRDQTIKLWDVASRREIATLSGHHDSVNSVAFSRDGKLLASGSGDGSVRFRDLGRKQTVAILKSTRGTIKSVAFSPDGKMLATGSEEGAVTLWDAAPKPEGAILRGHSQDVESVAFSPDGKLLASGSSDRTIRLWDVGAGREVAKLKGHRSSVTSVAFSPDGKLLASASWDRTVNLWDVSKRQVRPPLQGHAEAVTCVAFSPDGRMLASGSYDKTIRLWNVATGHEVTAPLKGHGARVNALAFSPDGRTLASGSADMTIRLWDVARRRERAKLTGHTQRIFDMAFSPDGRTLASVGVDKTVRLWDVATGKFLFKMEGHSAGVIAVAFSRDGKVLATGSWDNSLRLWNLAVRQQVAALQQHRGDVWSVAFSPDGQTLASGSSDKTVRLWHAPTFAETDSPAGVMPRRAGR